MSERNEEPGGMGINGVIPGDGECVVDGCDSSCSFNALMCPTHWRQVPRGLKDNLLHVWRRWNRGGGVTLEDVRLAQWACVDSLG